MKTTFSELGILFPLYEAPVEANKGSNYTGLGWCSVCGAGNRHCFRLGIGTDIVLPCPSCQAQNGLSVSDQASMPCRFCNTLILFPDHFATLGDPKVCYSCLRAGRVTITKNTEFGMITWEQALSGVTHGVPGLQQTQFESVVIDSEEEWIGAKVPTEMMFELLRTPTYDTWQGESWLFCCKCPMTFIGEWKQAQFHQHARSGDGKSLFYEIVADMPEAWNSLAFHLCVYVFECKSCGRLRTHHDSD